ncbi:MAG: Gfo/Idh/MocA family oxidoreductase [Pirellulales bacterium]|nr:Gfo/Idh/MocA family oxidoreductase [Pirellulales bacterium]
MKTIRFGLIGCGMMGREFASAVARWCHLPEMETKPEIVAVCNRTLQKTKWFSDHFPTIRQVTDDYRELLANPSVEAVYIAVPNHLHAEFYCAAIEAGKHLLGEKPFGIDLPANAAILDCIARHPDIFVRCSSQFIFSPALQRIGKLIDAGAFGRILEVEAGFLHSSDLDPQKPINWKRRVASNGVYGCVGDLGMHICAIPFRAGWKPQTVRAILSNIVPVRPDGIGGMVPCDTWDNATLFCDTVDPASGERFPMTLKAQRIAPGEKNTYYLRILGTRTSASFSTKNPKCLELLEYAGGEQVWGRIEMGQEMAFASITGGIFEWGFSDLILQMWAAFLDELEHGRPLSRFAGCVRPEETAASHRLFTAALESHAESRVVKIDEHANQPAAAGQHNLPADFK